MATVVKWQERRDFSRMPMHRSAWIEVGGAAVACTLADLSLRGALVRLPRATDAPPGAACTLVIVLDGGLDAIRMRGTVAHREEQTLGMRCRELDVESIFHLRRLLQAHLGEERLLHREMEALLARAR
jgi:hypothetical protein